MPPCRLRRRKFSVITHITLPPPATPHLENLFFACFRFLIIHPFFSGGQLTPLLLCADARAPWRVTLSMCPNFVVHIFA